MRSAESACLEVAERQYGLISRTQALGLGMKRSQLTRRLANGAWQQVLRGVYRLGPVPESPRQRLAAAVLWFGEQAVVSHLAAAWLWGLPGFEPCVELSVASSSHWEGPGFAVHSVPDLASNDLCRREGFLVTSAARTLFDIAPQCPERELAVAMDDALRRGIATLGQLRKVLNRLGGSGKPGTERFRKAFLERAGHRASGESPPETDLRRFIVQAGLPAPTPQHPIDLGPLGHCRLDLAYPDLKLAIEVWSDAFHSDRFQGKRDAGRITQLTARGWRVLEPVAEELEEDVRPFLKLLAETLVEVGGPEAAKPRKRLMPRCAGANP